MAANNPSVAILKNNLETTYSRNGDVLLADSLLNKTLQEYSLILNNTEIHKNIIKNSLIL